MTEPFKVKTTTRPAVSAAAMARAAATHEQFVGFRMSHASVATLALRLAADIWERKARDRERAE